MWSSVPGPLSCQHWGKHWTLSVNSAFSLLYAAEPPNIIRQPVSQKDIFQGRPVSFIIRGTGTKPLSYQWQWKPAGTEGEQHEWQDLPCDGTTFQEVEGGLKLTGVLACHAGDYRCVVSNSAGKEISQCASLTVSISKYTVVENEIMCMLIFACSTVTLSVPSS